MEIHTSSHTTYKTYRQSYLLSNLGKKDYKLWQNAFLILSSILFILTLCLFIVKPTESRFNSFISGSFPFFINLIIIPIPPKFVFKSQGKILTIPNDYTFYEDEFRIEAKNSQYSETTVIKYSFLDKVYETDENFYLYTNHQTAIPICKDGINPNEIDELRTRLISQLETDKYIKCK